MSITIKNKLKSLIQKNNKSPADSSGKKTSIKENTHIDITNDKKSMIKENMNYQKIENISEGSKKNEILFEDFLKIKNFEKKKILEDDNVFNFYNSLSYIMLSMLGGGVIGVIFILFFSFKNDHSKFFRDQNQ